MFGLVMGQLDNCKECLQRILNVEIEEIEHVKDHDYIPNPSGNKSIILDCYVKGSGTKYAIEMQTAKRKNLPKRSRFYQDLMDINELGKGSAYETLSQNIIIFICDFDPYDKEVDIYRFENYDTEEKLEFGDETTKIFINLQAKIFKGGPALKILIDYFRDNVVQDTYTSEINEQIKQFKKDKKKREQYMIYETKLHDQFKDGLEEGIEKGLEEGRQEGRQEEKQNSQQRVIELYKKGEVDETLAAKFLGIDVSEFRKLLKEQ